MQAFSNPSSSTGAMQELFCLYSGFTGLTKISPHSLFQRDLLAETITTALPLFVFFQALRGNTVNSVNLLVAVCQRQDHFAALLREDDTCSHQRAVEKIVPQGLLVVFMNLAATHIHSKKISSCVKHHYKRLHLLLLFSTSWVFFIPGF